MLNLIDRVCDIQHVKKYDTPLVSVFGIILVLLVDVYVLSRHFHFWVLCAVHIMEHRILLNVQFLTPHLTKTILWNDGPTTVDSASECVDVCVT